MADGVDLTIDAAKLAADGDRLVRRYLSAGTGAVSETTRRLEQRLEDATEASGGKRLARAWQSSRYPERGPARNPVGTIWLKGGARTRGAIAFWTQPGAIVGREGQYLAIPLPAAGSRGRSRMLTPVEWEAEHNIELRPVFRPGRAPLLVADQGTTNARSGVFRPITRARTAADQRRGFVRGEQTVPIFVLMPLVRFRNAFAIDPLVLEAEGELRMEFFAQIRAIQQN